MVFILMFLGFCLFYGLGSYGLLNNNEGLYAQIPREMLASRSFVIPLLNGVPYIEKPPLLYWLIGASYQFFGVHEFSARLVPALLGLLTCLFLARFAGPRISPRVGGMAAWILGTSVGYIIFARMVFFDVALTFFLSGALLLFFSWWEREKRQNLWGTYLFLALAVLTKGGVALVLAGLVVGLFFLWTRPGWRKFKDFFDLWGLLLFFAVSVPWHVAASLEDPGFAWFYFMNEHVLRFLGMREPHDYYHGPVYYYVHRLLIYFVPWCFLFGVFVVRAPVRRDPNKDLKIFLRLWFFVTFLFFSFSQAKANYYLVTVMPPLALLLAIKLYESWEKTRSYVRGVTLGISLLLPGLLILGFYLGDSLSQNLPVPLDPQATAQLKALPILGLALWLGFNLFAFFGIGKAEKKPLGLPILLGLQPAILLFFALPVIQGFEDRFSAKGIAEPLAQTSNPVYLYRDYEKISSVLFYVGRPVVIIDSLSNDLLYGENSGKRSDLFITSAQFKEVVETGPSIRCFAYKEQFQAFDYIFPEVLLEKEKGPIRLYGNF